MGPDNAAPETLHAIGYPLTTRRKQPGCRAIVDGADQAACVGTELAGVKGAGLSTVGIDHASIRTIDARVPLAHAWNRGRFFTILGIPILHRRLPADAVNSTTQASLSSLSCEIWRSNHITGSAHGRHRIGDCCQKRVAW